MNDRAARLPDRSEMFLLPRQRSLLQGALAPWKRRNTTLLSINCGGGSLLPLFWECGFDVTACEGRPELRRQAGHMAPCGVEVVAAQDDYLPFGPDSFDWVVLQLGAHDETAAALAVEEAVRVAVRGLAITFWNAASLPAVLRALCPARQTWPGLSLPWWQVLRLGRPYGSWHLYGTLHLPGGRGEGLFSRLGRWCSWMGAWCVLRIDLHSSCRVTPLGLPVRGGKAQLEPSSVLERHAPLQACGNASARETS